MTKYALITGGTSGIGLEFASLLAAENYNLLLVSLQSEEEISNCKKHLEETYKVTVKALRRDLSQGTAAQELYDYCQENKLEIEILINNAGFFFFKEVVEVPIEKASALILLHVHTTALLCTLFGQDMKKRKKGYILNTSSIASYKDFPGIAYYGASKKFIRGFSRSLHTEMKYYNVHVTALCPGATATNLYDPNVINVQKGMKWGIMMTSLSVATVGIKGMFRNKAIVVPGFLTKVMLIFSILTPHWVIYILRKKLTRFF